MISWKTDKSDIEIINQITQRAFRDVLVPGRNFLDLNMDITAAHSNGCRLKLAELLKADDFNFAHDIIGIVRNLDRDTGKLMNCFCPRYSE